MTRDEFILANMGLAVMVAKRSMWKIKNNPAIDREDLISLGVEGLIKAYDNFDPSFGTQFSTYAVTIIHGTISKHLMKSGDLVSFSRQDIENYHSIVRVGLIGEDPKTIAKKMNKPLAHIKRALNYSKCRHVDYLQQTIYEDEGKAITLGERIGVEPDLDSDIDIKTFLEQLDERTRKIVTLRMQGLSQTEISDIIGLGQVQISRILLRVKKQMKEKLKVVA